METNNMKTEELLKNISNLLKKHNTFLNSNPELFHIIEDRLLKALNDDEYDSSVIPEDSDEESQYGENLFSKKPKEKSFTEESDGEEGDDSEDDDQSIDEDEQYAENTTPIEEEETPKSRSKMIDWKPKPEHTDNYSPEEEKAVRDAVNKGYTRREAEKHAGIHHDIYNNRYSDFETAKKSSVRANEPSAAMIKDAMPQVNAWMKNHGIEKNKNLDQAKNPGQYMGAKAEELHQAAHGDYDKEYNEHLKQIKDLKGMDRVKSIKNFKTSFNERNPDYANKAADAVNAAHKERVETAEARKQRIKESEQQLVNANVSGGGGTTSEWSLKQSGNDDTPMSSNAAGQIVGTQIGDEGSYSTNTKSTPQSFAANISQSGVDKAQAKLDEDAKQEEKQAYQNFPKEKIAKFTPEQKALWDAHGAKFGIKSKIEERMNLHPIPKIKEEA